MVAITFDDGFNQTYENIYEFLLIEHVPVTFFISTSHVNKNNLLWFSYLKALCFEDIYKSITVDQRTFKNSTHRQRKRMWKKLRGIAIASKNPVGILERIKKLYPIPLNIVEKYSGMTPSHLQAASQSTLFTLGAHTESHPYLPQLSLKQQEEEISKSRDYLTSISGKPVLYFAYPSGEYNQDTLAIVEKIGFQAAFAIIPKNLGNNPMFEISRIGIYSDSLLKFKLKLLGMVKFGRLLGLPIG